MVALIVHIITLNEYVKNKLADKPVKNRIKQNFQKMGRNGNNSAKIKFGGSKLVRIKEKLFSRDSGGNPIFGLYVHIIAPK